jgi:hypothetical protein
MTTYFSLAPSLRMSGVVLPLHPHAFKVCTRTLPFFLSLHSNDHHMRVFFLLRIVFCLFFFLLLLLVLLCLLFLLLTKYGPIGSFRGYSKVLFPSFPRSSQRATPTGSPPFDPYALCTPSGNCVCLAPYLPCLAVLFYHL